MTKPPARIAFVLCGILCLIYVGLSLSAASDKSATYDEPLHVATGWLNLWRADFRLSPDVPPLWEYWIALPLGRNALDFDATPTDQSLDHRAIAALYQTPPANGVALVERSRWMNLPIALSLAVLIAAAAGAIGGPIAAVAAMFVFVFDPDWLGHGPLAKNDVAFALVYFAAALAVWRVGRRATPKAIVAAIVLPSLCLGTKFSGLAVGPVLAIMLICRAFMRDPWPIGSTELRSRASKLALAASLCVAALVVAYFGLWAQYQFRFDAGPGGLQLDLPAMQRDLRDAEVRSQYQINDPTPAQLAQWRPSCSTSAILWLQQHKLVPQAWAAGYIYTQTSASERTAYLLGDLYHGGKVAYFPLAWLFKEPLAMIAATLAAVLTLARRKSNWTALALCIPACIYGAIALFSSLNIGLRHIFPVVPFIDLAIGLAAAKAWSVGRARGRLIVLVLAAGLAAETLSAYPDFISFFNIACGRERGGLALLGDSNLDWGQDLPLLARWQQAHPDVPLYLDYFGTCDPAAYGIRYFNTIGGYVYSPSAAEPRVPGVAAISASKLQRLFVTNSPLDFARQFEHAQPIDVLGGSIYLFQFPP